MNIVIRITGGIGNQLFQYSFGRSLFYYYGCEVKYDLSTFDNVNGIDCDIKYSLRNFNVEMNIADTIDIAKFKMPTNKDSWNWIRSLVNFYNSRQVIHERKISFDKNYFKLKEGNYYLSGYFQTEKYFSEIESVIRKELSFNSFFLNTFNYESVSKDYSNCLCVHVRRGDYINSSIHVVLPLDYYINAINYVFERVGEIKIKYFSDDPDWVQKNLISVYPGELSISNSPISDLYRMSKCSHYVLSNSSFSWWSAWLNEVNSKIVVVPALWYKIDKQNRQTFDLIPIKWVKL